MFLYWPVVLIGVTFLLIFFPAPILFHRSRMWWLYSNVSGTIHSKTNPSLKKSCTSVLTYNSGDYSYRVHIQLSFETSSWETCTVRKPTL